MEEYSYPKCEVCREIYSLCATCKAWHKQCQCDSGQNNTIRMTEEEIERLYVEDHKTPELVAKQELFPVVMLPAHIKEMLHSIYNLEDFDNNQGLIIIVDFMQIQDQRTSDALMMYAEQALAYLNPVTRKFVEIGE